MRALPTLVLVASCACSCAHSARGPSAQPCDVLPVNAAAALMTFATDLAAALRWAANRAAACAPEPRRPMRPADSSFAQTGAAQSSGFVRWVLLVPLR